MRLWKILGLAGAAGLVATGVVVGRRRTRRNYDADELRERLHDRLDDADAKTNPDQHPPRLASIASAS